MPLDSFSRSNRPTLLIVGCGDIGMRVIRLLRGRVRIVALTSDRDRFSELRTAGAVPVFGNLDDASSLVRISALADRVLHLAPPPSHGDVDARTRHLLQALAVGGRTRRLVYGSTTGVYGDCGGARFDETRAVNPTTDRARRRVDAENQLRQQGRGWGLHVTILRIPGIYALDRSGGDPRQRVARGAPVLAAEDDVFTNHIHADDLASACVAALFRGRRQRVVHVSDGVDMKMGDYFDLVADLSGQPRPPRISRAQAAVESSAMTLSFMSESRRLTNDRLKRELRVRLRYASVRDAFV